MLHQFLMRLNNYTNNTSNNTATNNDSNNVSTDWELVKLYLPLLKKITQNMHTKFPYNFGIDEIYGIGLIGLINASTKYKNESGVNFAHYASIKIRCALLDELRKMDWLPRHLRTKVKIFKKNITNAESSKLALSKADKYFLKKNKIIKYLKNPVFISINDEKFSNDKSRLNLDAYLIDKAQKTSYDVCNGNDIYFLLKTQLNHLSNRDKKIIKLYYYDDMYLNDIAKKINLKNKSIWKIHSNILHSMRKNLSKIFKEIPIMA